MTGLLAYLARPLVQFAVMAFGVLALWGSFALFYETKGAAKQTARTEKANAQVIQRANRVRAKSVAGGVRGVVDPNYID